MHYEDSDFCHLKKPDLAMRYFSIVFSATMSLHSGLLNEVRFWLTTSLVVVGYASTNALVLGRAKHPLMFLAGLAVLGAAVGLWYIFKFWMAAPSVADISAEPILSMADESLDENAQAYRQLKSIGDTYRKLHEAVIVRERLTSNARKSSIFAVFLAVMLWMCRLN